MSEQFGNTQPTKPPELDDTQPIKPIQGNNKTTPRWRSTLFSILGFLLLIGLGSFGGYNSGINARQSAERNALSGQLAEQYSFALVDMEFGHYENARQRLEYIIQKDPTFPGAQEKLTEVMVKSSIPTAAPTATITPTPDYSGAESALARAQELLRAQDWAGAMGALDSVRKFDPTYQAAKVDGMYYVALRNHGYSLITQQGNLEGGIYYLTLAERFGPLDNNAKGLREGARTYITGASFWELNWPEAIVYFEQVALGWPSLWDGTMTASQRYYIALMRYGDELYYRENYCDAYDYYQAAASLSPLESGSANNANNAYNVCYPPTPTPDPLEIPTLPTEEEPTVEP